MAKPKVRFAVVGQGHFAQKAVLPAFKHVKNAALTEADCEAMIRVCADNGAKLMIAYRLHFEEANLKSVALLQKGKLGEPRFFDSTFSFQVHDDNIRVGSRSDGGGPLYDIGA